MPPDSPPDESTSSAAIDGAAQAASSGGDAAARAFADLAAVLGEIEAKYIVPDRGMVSAAERAAGRNLIETTETDFFQAEVRTFLDAGREGRSPVRGNVRDAVRLMRVIEEIRTARVR